MGITASDVKALRDRTGAGLMECKRALLDSNGDLERAVGLMRKRGLAKADKKAGRTAAEGRLALVGDDRVAALVEVNTETDFVAAAEELADFADAVARIVVEASPQGVEAACKLCMPSGQTVDEARRELVAKLGENIALRRIARMESSAGKIGRYLHGIRIGVMVEVQGADEKLAKDLAMHIAASSPLCVGPKDVPPELAEREREAYRVQAEQSGKSAEIIARMVDGRLAKYLNEVALTGQPFVKNPDLSVGKLLASAGANVERFVRFEVGEGIDRDKQDFAAEVMAQVRGG